MAYDLTGFSTINGDQGADLLVGGASNVTFVFNRDAVWSRGQSVVNLGDAGSPGTGDSFSLAGYGRSYDVFVGSGTGNTLVLPNGHNAFFLDDATSPGVDATRLYNIQTIEVGNGSQIVNLTSTRITYGDITIVGGSGDDIFLSNAGNDILSGGNGKDYLWGGSGNDQLYGGQGADTLLGGSGDDLLDGGTGSDAMTGGTGNDTYVVESAGDSVVELAGGGTDLVRSSIAYTLAGNVENLTLTGSSAVNGTGNALDNQITGNSAENVLGGGAGNDHLNAGGGADRVIGGDGNDKLFGEDGNDTMYGDAGNDVLNGGAGEDKLYGGTGDDGFFGGGSNDRIYGEDGNDKIYGDGGNDVISGGRGNDIMTGGQFTGGYSLGNDTFAWARADVVAANGSSSGFDHITDFGAGDRLDFSGLLAGAPPVAANSVLRATDTAAGTVVAASVDGGAHFLDVVMLDGQHGLDIDTLLAGGSIAV